MDENSSLGSIDSEYDMGSVQRDLKFLAETPSLKEMVLSSQQPPRVPSPFLGLRPANPAMQALSSQKREAHNRSPVSFREGRRASDTSLTQGNCSCQEESPLLLEPWAHLVILGFFVAGSALARSGQMTLDTMVPLLNSI